MLSVLKLSIGNYNACPCLVYVYFGKNILKISSNKFQKPRPYCLIRQHYFYTKKM